MHAPPARLLLTLVWLVLSSTARADTPPSSEAAYEQAVSDLQVPVHRYIRMQRLCRAAEASLKLGFDAEAKSFAEEARQIGREYTEDSIYGRIAERFHSVLGQVALHAGDRPRARKHLLAIGRSRSRAWFGPNMTLAREMLAAGESAVVLEYFELCRGFWRTGGGFLDDWKADVEQGRMPEFGANLRYGLDD